MFTYNEIVSNINNFYKAKKIQFCFLKIHFPWQCHSFVGDVKRNVVELNDMYKKMGSMFEDMSEYFCFDKKQYKMNDFFGDIKTFQDNFKVLSFISNIFCFNQDNVLINTYRQIIDKKWRFKDHFYLTYKR